MFETKKHLISEHGIDEYKPYQCNHCDSKQRKNYDLIQHYERNHIDIENRPKFVCDECGKELLTKTTLKRHKTKVHEKQGNSKKTGDIEVETRLKFICEECGKELLSKASLKRHIEFKHTDTSENNFVCTQCGKRFMLNNSLQRHSKFNCNNGEKKKRKKKNHRTFTSDLKKYFCDSCKKEYSLKSKRLFDRHVNKCHGNGTIPNYIQSIKCSKCDETFSAENIYIKHYQSKHGGIPIEYIDKEKFMCDKCPGIFLERHKLHTHKTNVHKVKNELIRASHLFHKICIFPSY